MISKEMEMSAERAQPEGVDLRSGVALGDLAEGEPFLGHIDEQSVVLVRRGEEVLAIGGTCTHYGGPLAEGLVVGETIRCPWHHACFSLQTGEALGAPALNPVPRFRVEVRDGIAHVQAAEQADPLESFGRQVEGPESVVIVGAGAAGSAAAEMLRREGYGGRISLVDPDIEAPYDRPNLSKDYLAGSAPEEWIPLRPLGFYPEHRVERINARVESIGLAEKSVQLTTGVNLRFGALLLATGAVPVRLDIPGADLPHVRTLRSLADSRAIIADAEAGRRAVVLGASFIGMEVAASLGSRGVRVAVVAPESVPFERTLGEALGGVLRSAHEASGVKFHLGETATEIRPDRVILTSGVELPAELVIVGVGVRPDTSLAEVAGLRVENGVLVNEFLETSAPGVFAAGDIARYPDPDSGLPVRVEHWAAAQRQGQAAARNILGKRKPFTDPPFFWTRQWDVGISYVGNAGRWQEVRVDGDLSGGDGAVRYLRDGQVQAVATVGRDLENLLAEVELESRAGGASARSRSGE
jgi:NADPH-dependent 2,4-dienoyl-CoA reductase/sulfur reductase-like enzyme/nitrite reductase/ring-hydroxylating ferredoxin subunit